MTRFSAVAVLLTLSACRRSEPLPVYSSVGDFELTDQNGHAFHGRSLYGKIWVADFIYTQCPGPCPRMTSQMHQVQQATEKMRDLNLVSFTVDPEHDSPAVLTAYAKAHHAQHDRWFFLTGGQAALNQLCLNAFKLGKVDGTLEHSTRFVLVDKKSQIRGYYDTSESGSIPKLIEDIHAVAREQS
jgi:protein SCO1/2